MLARGGKLGPALKDLEKAAELVPEDPRHHYALDEALRKLGGVERARESLERFRELSR